MQQMERLNPAIQFLLGHDYDRPATLPRYVQRSAAVANLFHVCSEPLTKVSVGYMARLRLSPQTALCH
jgi:hypothetical protein